MNLGSETIQEMSLCESLKHWLYASLPASPSEHFAGSPSGCTCTCMQLIVLLRCCGVFTKQL